jgi:periplasmic protein TonB
MQAMLAPLHDERRLIAVSVVASVALHAAALALGPRLVHEHPLEPPQVLSVLLRAPAEEEEVAPPTPPPPPVPRAPARPAPRAAVPVPPRVAAPQPAPAPADPMPATVTAPVPVAPARESPTGQEAPVAAAPREPSSPPDFRAAYLRNPPPGYPAAARRNGEEGTVTLRVLVSAEGAPREVALERSSGSSLLDAAALAAVKTWRFTPARRGGEAQEAWVLVPIVFRLEPRG